MSFHFNWSRLDETSADVIRLLINQRLEEFLKRSRCGNERGTDREGSAAGGIVTGYSDSGFSTALEGGLPPDNEDTISTRSGAIGGVSGFSSTAVTQTASGMAGEASSILTGAAPGAGAGTAGVEVSSIHADNPGYTSSLYGFVESQGGGAANLPFSGSSMSLAIPSCGGGGVTAGLTKVGPPLTDALAPPNARSQPVTPSLPAQGTSPLRTGGPGHRTNSPKVPATTEESKVPLIEYVEITSLEWGTAPPFIEIVSFEDALADPPTSQPIHHSGPISQTSSGSFSMAVNSTAMTPSASLSTLRRGSTDECNTRPMAATPDQTRLAAVGLVDSMSDSSNENGSTAATSMQRVRGASAAYVAGCGVTSSSNYTLHGGDAGDRKVPSIPAPLPSPVEDSLASVLGQGGLFLRLHLTYGGSLRCSVCTTVQKELRLGALSLCVSLPMAFTISDLDLDCYICMNLKRNECRLWLEPGPLSTSVINRLSIAAVFGGEGDNGGDVDRTTSTTTDRYSRFGSSASDYPEDGQVYIDEQEVSQFILHELRIILKEMLVAPHFVSVPVFFGE